MFIFHVKASFKGVILFKQLIFLKSFYNSHAKYRTHLNILTFITFAEVIY
jgi:hypothetical protein